MLSPCRPKLAEVTGNGHPVDLFLDVEAGVGEEGFELLDDGHVPVAGPADLVHFIDQDDQVAHAHALGQERVFPRLAALFKAAFELALLGTDDESTDVGLTGALDHVGHVVLVAGRVDDREAFVLGLEEGLADLDGLALGPLLGALVHDVGQVPALAVVLLGLELVLLQLVEVHEA